MAYAYVGLATLKSALGITDTADDARLRGVLEGVARQIDGDVGRTFRVVSATRYLTPGSTEVLLLDRDLVGLTSLKSDEGGDGVFETTWASSDYLLAPYNAPADEEPYWRIETAPGGAQSFPVAQRSVEIVGRWSWWQELVSTTTLAEDLDTTETAVDVTSAASLEVGQTILTDSEQMYITGISSATLTVDRGVNGTTAATHSNAAAVSRYRYPANVVEASLIQAGRVFRRKDAPFGVVGSAEMGSGIVIARLDPDVRMMLDPFRLARVA